MKVQLTFKTPEVLDQLVDQVEESELEYARDMCNQYLEYGEYLTVEFNIDPVSPPKVSVIRQK